MESITTFRHRLDWTRAWLDNFKRSATPLEEAYEIVSHQPEATEASNYGIESISSSCSRSDSGEPTVESYQEDGEPIVDSYEEDDFFCFACARAYVMATVPQWKRIVCYHCIGKDLCHCRSLFGDLDPLEFEPASRYLRDDDIAYELAGRKPLNDFRDLRSASKARKRKRRENEKYFQYKAVKPGWLGKQFFDVRIGRPEYEGVLLRDAPVITMTKTMMYQEAQRYPRPPTYHHRNPGKEHWPWQTRKGWCRKKTRKHAKHWIEAEEGQCREEMEFLERDPDVWTSSGWPWGPDGCAEDTEMFWTEPRTYDWCDECDVQWGNCNVHYNSCGAAAQRGVAWSGCVVDEVEQLTFESDKETGKWTLTSQMDPWEAERPNRAPATIPYGKRDWVRHPYPEHFTEDDLVW